MGFKATEAVEELTYDFRPHVDEYGTITEPTGKAVEAFRNRVFGSLKESGLDPEVLKDMGLADMDELLAKSSAVEEETVNAVADLTGIANQSIWALPYRIRAAFVGWIMGQFFSPEA